MGEEVIEPKNISKMFIKGGPINPDEQLAIEIMHRFNIDRDTMECMPAFDPHIKPMFSREKQK